MLFESVAIGIAELSAQILVDYFVFNHQQLLEEFVARQQFFLKRFASVISELPQQIAPNPLLNLWGRRHWNNPFRLEAASS